MFHRALIGLATAGLVAVGALAPEPATAATSPSFSLTVTSQNFAFRVGNSHPRPYLVCHPTYKRVYYWYHGHRYSRLVRTGQSCHWVYPRPPRGPYRPY
jgi:hypothetical protein